MKKNIKYIGILTMAFSMSACTDYFLDLEPTDQQTEANFYKTAAEFEAAANSTYSFYGFHDVTEKVNGTNYTHTLYNIWDNNSDVIAGVDEAASGTLGAKTTDAYWSLCYAKIRKCNIVIDKASEYTGSDNISASVGTAKFFRAYQYFWLLRRFGGVPLILHPLSSSSAELYAARNSRYEVMAQIMSDLNDAIESLPDESAYDGHITKQGAQAFKARVMLFEGTWEKYVGTTTDGDGITSGAGSTKPSSYPSINEMISEAASLAESVMASGKYQLWNASGTVYDKIAYNYLFNLEDENTNPMGFTKAKNHEYILQIPHDHTSYRSGKNITHSYGGDNNTLGAVTLKWMNMVPCATDGLPYLYSKDYKGYHLMTDVYDNRDSRLTSCIKRPGSYYYMMGSLGADATRYKNADYVTTFDFPTGEPIYYPTLTSSGQTGFQNRKMTSERYNYGDTEESYNYPVLRYAEVLLIYAEAKCELGNGTISDDDLNKSINLLHDRAGSARITNASVAQANANYLTNTGKAGKMTILQLIRNERAVELRCENERPYDLLRWATAEEELNASRLGVVVKNADGTDTQIKGFTYQNGKVTTATFDNSAAPYGFETIEDGSQALIVNDKSQFNMQRKNYLNPVPLNELQLNKALVQNPGY
jgi:hypothetical protein